MYKGFGSSTKLFCLTEPNSPCFPWLRRRHHGPAPLSHHSCLDLRGLSVWPKGSPISTCQKLKTPQLGTKGGMGRSELSDFRKLRVWGSWLYKLSIKQGGIRRLEGNHHGKAMSSKAKGSLVPHPPALKFQCWVSSEMSVS